MPDIIAYFKMGIGNLILFTPALQALATMDKSGQIDLCLDSRWNDSRRPAIDDFIANCPFINKVINYPKEAFPKQYSRWFYTVHTESSDAFNVFQARNQIQSNHVNWAVSRIHEAMYYMEAVQKWGFNGQMPAQFCPVTEPKDISIHNKSIALCNGSFGHIAAQKKWGGFVNLADMLTNMEYKTIGLGCAGELAGVSLSQDFTGKLKFTESAYVLSKCKMIVTTDSALMHAADALGVPVVAIFGGSLVSKNAPINSKYEIVTNDIKCRPCQGREEFNNCPDPRCLNNIETGSVINAVRNLLSRI